MGMQLPQVWGDFVVPHLQHAVRDGHEPDAQRVIAFWAELDESLGRW
jgi:hypothetical protein